MKTGVREFQIYLLARMTAKEPVLASLEELDASEAETRDVVAYLDQQTVSRRDVGLYVDMLGQPQKDKPFPGGTGSFSGSTRSYFSLALWPKLYFAVNETPAGVVWGEEFERRDALSTIGEHEIEPWQVCLSDLRRPGVSMSMEDGWDESADWEVSFDAGKTRFRAAFSWGLLQCWEQMGEQERFCAAEAEQPLNWFGWMTNQTNRDGS